MIELLPGFFQLPLAPRSAVNAYFSDGVLFDAGSRFDGGKVLRALEGRTVWLHALTHGHGDHQGGSHAVCQALGVPLVCGAADADAVASGDIRALSPANAVTWALAKLAGPGHPVARRLRDGDEVEGFTVIETPGHSPGHVAYWRAADRVLVAGDVLANMDIRTTIPGLQEPPRVFTQNPALNRRSARRLRDLDPALVVFGHGPPLRDPAAFRAFLDRLPA